MRAFTAERKEQRKVAVPQTREPRWVVGPDEIAGVVTAIANAIPNSYRVSYLDHPFYDLQYDYNGPSGNWFGRLRAEAKHFGTIAARSHGFIYVGPNGYLRSNYDARLWEFKFLRKRGLYVICYFTGTDIRSLKKMAELERQTGLPNVGTRVELSRPGLRDGPKEQVRKDLARSADDYAHIIFNAAKDQLSYLERPTEPFMYFFETDQILSHGKVIQKHMRRERLRVFHAPSSPVIKGTELVRQAVNALREEGFEFDYIEVTNIPHKEVVEHLRNSDIVMNQFYAFMPGMFGIEAMAAGAVTLMSADPEIETDLAAGAAEAWVKTKHNEVKDKLRQVLLQSAEERCEQALRGRDWVEAHATKEINGPKIRKLLEDLK